MATTGVPPKYALFNAESSKSLAYVVKITGVPDVLTTIDIGTRVLYGDPGVKYGTAGLVYGGLRPYTASDGSSFRALLDLSGSSLQINQRIEPEQGKSTVSTVSLAFVDKDGYMTNILSPGQVITEPLGAEVQIFVGYQPTSYPQDFLRIFRGYISQIDVSPGSAVIQISDANLKRRQQLFFTAQTTTTATFLSTDTSLSVQSTNGFYTLPIGPSGGIDEAATPYVLVDQEWIVTEPSGLATCGQWLDPDLGVHAMTRSQRGTTAAASVAAGATVQTGIQLSDDPMSMALKIMLSGWDGPWISGIPMISVGPFPDPSPFINSTNFVLLPSNVDAVGDYGLVIGDWISIQNSPLNPDIGMYQIIGFSDLDGQTNRMIEVNASLFKEGPTPGTLSFRSQFDTYPVDCGLQLTPKDVDVQGHINIRNTFLGSSPNLLTIFVSAAVTSGKQFIEQEIYLPVGCFSLTYRGLLSVGITIPPLAGAALQVLDKDNILNAPQLKVSRMTNGRYFYNEIDYLYDVDDQSNFQSTSKFVDGPSLANMGFTNTLEIDSQGLRTFTKPTGAGAAAGQPGTYPAPTDAGIYVARGQRNFLSRFKAGSAPLQVITTWEQGSLIECGDIVQVTDDGTLQIANFATGTRGLQTQLLFVTERTLDMKAGNATLSLISAFATQLTDRFATISPSSVVGTGSTTSSIIITPSFGELFGASEWLKWTDIIGLKIMVHNADYSVSASTVLTGFDPVNPLKMLINTIGFTPPAGYIVQLDDYSTVSASDQQAVKTVYAYLTPTVSVVSGIDAVNFTVGSGDIAKFFTGSPIRIHSTDFTTDSGDTDFFVKAIDLGTNKITLTAALPFTPSAGQHVDLIGFQDDGGPYRFV